MQTTKHSDNIRIMLAIAGKDILDAVKNKVTLSLLFTVLFLLVLYTFLPTLESEPVIRIYDAGNSNWMPALADSGPARISQYKMQTSLEYRISRSGGRDLGLILPIEFDEAIAAGGPVELQGYLLDWINEKETADILVEAEAQVTGVVGVPVNIQVERVSMLPESTGAGLTSAAGILLLVMMIGMLLVPNLMIEEKRIRTLDVLLVSPATAGQIVAGKALTGLFYSLLGLGLACIFTAYLITQWGLALLSGISAALFSVSLGLLLGMQVSNRQQLTIWGNLLVLPIFITLFLSTMTDVFPAWLITICRWLPSTIAFDLLRASFTPHTNSAFIVPRLAVILGTTAILLGIVAWKIRRSDRE